MNEYTVSFAVNITGKNEPANSRHRYVPLRVRASSEAHALEKLENALGVLIRSEGDLMRDLTPEIHS